HITNSRICQEGDILSEIRFIDRIHANDGLRGGCLIHAGQMVCQCTPGTWSVRRGDRVLEVDNYGIRSIICFCISFGAVCGDKEYCWSDLKRTHVVAS